ncbi:hypothetical protein [Mucilaginibacter sp.]|uniref:hypothetical protein n=1 Tax=Mucilaginibacter sp. TaxID=1882438 RepID=UPI0035BBF0DB
MADAIALNILHETVKHFDKDAPRVDLVGEEAITKGLQAVGAVPPTGQNLYLSTLAADLLSNAFYYSLIGGGKRKNLLIRGIGYGAVAGYGALKLTKPLGLNDSTVTRTDKTKALTVAYYTLGGLVAAITIKALRQKSKFVTDSLT